ncbi:hypothetical protein HO173_000098 [Letharia columbiana]|uniref:Ankyrin n=1 Tax=Letharia columbiana TaxID=112416 RepID=A0A8H6G6A9_9LECA|nr:uncharacterized protein HO173_000098 [Letharia columbiana]KAF6241388.1 hypothetical protein HO173_000098 [Letharia columbiana]
MDDPCYVPQESAHVGTSAPWHGTALQAASSSGHVEIVQMLLEEGVDVNAPGTFRFLPGTALEAAIGARNEEVARLLIEKGAGVKRVDRAGEDPLELASYQGLRRVVELILDKDVVVKVQGERYSRALTPALRGGQQEIVQILLDKGTIINAQAMKAAGHGEGANVLQMLLEHGGDPSVPDRQGRTCLHHEATGKKGNSSAVPWLLKEGHDPNLPDRDGWTPLHWAAKTGNAETIEILEYAGAEFSIEFIMGWTPDDVAVFHHHKISWKTKTALGCGVQTSEPTLEEDTSTASLKAEARDP